MGLVIKRNIMTLWAALGNYAFLGDKPMLDWGGGGTTTCSVTQTLGTRVSSDYQGSSVNLGDSLTVHLSSSDDLYVINPSSVKVKVGGVDMASTYYNENTDIITIPTVVDNVVIEASAMTYEPTNLAFHLDCKNGITKSGTIPTKWVDLAGNKEFTLINATEAQGGGVYFNGTNAYALYTGGALAIQHTEGTIEFVLGSSISTVRKTVILQNGYDGGICAIGQNNTARVGVLTAFSSTNTANFLSLKCDNIPIAASLNVYDNGRSCLVNGTKASASDTVIDEFHWTPLAGGAIGKMSIAGYIDADTGQIDTTTLREMTVLAIRVYSQQLTLAQAQKHYKIDKKRFNIS